MQSELCIGWWHYYTQHQAIAAVNEETGKITIFTKTNGPIVRNTVYDKELPAELLQFKEEVTKEKAEEFRVRLQTELTCEIVIDEMNPAYWRYYYREGSWLCSVEKNTGNITIPVKTWDQKNDNPHRVRLGNAHVEIKTLEQTIYDKELPRELMGIRFHCASCGKQLIDFAAKCTCQDNRKATLYSKEELVTFLCTNQKLVNQYFMNLPTEQLIELCKEAKLPANSLVETSKNTYVMVT